MLQVKLQRSNKRSNTETVNLNSNKEKDSKRNLFDPIIINRVINHEAFGVVGPQFDKFNKLIHRSVVGIPELF